MTPVMLDNAPPAAPAAVSAPPPAPDVQGYADVALQGLALVLAEQRPTVVPSAAGDLIGLLDAAVEDTVQVLAGHLHRQAGTSGLGAGPLELTADARGVGLLRGPSVRLVTTDPTVEALFHKAETLARALALGRVVVHAQAALAESPDQAEVLWEWLCERGERTKTAALQITVKDGTASASLTDAKGRALGAWGARIDRFVAA